FTRRLPLRFFSPRCADPQHLHSFPTRRSSDLGPPTTSRRAAATRSRRPGTWPRRGSGGSMRADPSAVWPPECAHEVDARAWVPRSEEHTSELQSRENLVCRLLLEKKKKKKKSE